MNTIRRLTGFRKKKGNKSVATTETIDAWIGILPKVELHVHLPGAFDFKVRFCDILFVHC